MSLPIESSAFHDSLVILAAAGLVIPAFAAIRISPVVGFILVGALVGPHGLGALAATYPWLSAITIWQADELAPIAEIGVAMLLFSLGLELSLDRLKTMRKLLLAFGPAQIVLCTAAVAGVLLPFALGWGATLTLAVAMAMSSTAVGLQLLSSAGKINSHTGRAAFAMLLFQDVALAPILLAIGVGTAAGGAALALAKITLALGAIIGIGNFALRPFFLQAARTRSPELFLAASMVVIIGAASIAAAAGLSPLIGAGAAGVLLAETEYRRQIEATIAPFQGLLLGVFLIYTGMRLDPAAIAARPVLLTAFILGLVAIKATIIALLLRANRQSWGTAAHTGLLLAPPSETSLVILGAAITAGLIGGNVASVALLTAALGLALAPLFGMAGAWLEAHLAERADTLPAPPFEAGGTIIIGFGRVGQVVADMLDRHGQPWLAIDGDPDTVARHRVDGRPVIFGDARRLELLDTLGLAQARAVVLTIDSMVGHDTMVRRIRADHPDLNLIVRARDAAHASLLYQLGVTDAVPETVEASLQLAEAVLVDLGVPMGPVIASIHEKRSELREEIEAAAPGPPKRALPPRERPRAPAGDSAVEPDEAMPTPRPTGPVV